MFPLAQAYVERSILVNDDDIRGAQQALWETLRVVAEPGGAAAMAALLSGKYRPTPGERVAVLLCGANTTAVRFACRLVTPPMLRDRADPPPPGPRLQRDVATSEDRSGGEE